MKPLKEKAKIDNAIMRITKVSELRHIVATTDKGELWLCLRKGETEKDYRFVLDAVPYSDDDNKELLALFNGILFTL